MYQVLLCTCRAIVLLIKAFVLPRCRRRCRRGLLKVPIVTDSKASLQSREQEIEQLGLDLSHT